jgi:hypothetical protein
MRTSRSFIGPTEVMLADFITEPLQGSLFRKFRAVLLGYEHVDTLRETPPIPTEERVGNSKLTRVQAGPCGQVNSEKRTYADVVKERP